MKKTIKTIDAIILCNKLDLDYKEKYSLLYSNGFMNLKEIKPKFLFLEAQEIINEITPVVAIIGIASIMYNVIKKIQNDKK